MIEKLWRFRKAHKLFIFHPLFPPSQTSTASKQWVIFKQKNTTSNFSSINHLECEALLHLPLFLGWGLDPIYSNIQPINTEHPTPPKLATRTSSSSFFSSWLDRIERSPVDVGEVLQLRKQRRSPSKIAWHRYRYGPLS